MPLRSFPTARCLLGLVAVLALGSTLLHWSPPAVAAEGKLFLASTNSAGELGNHTSLYSRVNAQALSADGTKVVFHSEATNLHPADTHPGTDIYVKDLADGRLGLVSVRDDGVKANAPSRHPAISGDGTKVAFETEATNLDPRDTDDRVDLYVKDLLSGSLALASTDSAGNKSFSGASGSSLSADGTKLAFASTGALSREQPIGDIAIYVKDLLSGHVQVASVAPDGRVAQVNGNGQLSGDGSRVVFASPTTLVPADSDNSFDPAHNRSDVYVKDLTTGDLLLADTTASGEKAELGAHGGSISGDGTRVAFSTESTNLDPRHPEQTTTVYVKDLASGALFLAGISEGGVIVGSYGAILSPDGSRVGFDAGTDPDEANGDGETDVYVKDLVTGALMLASSSASGANTAGDLWLGGLSANGARVVFTSGSPLTPEDDNNTWDVYVKTFSSVGPTTTSSSSHKDKDKDKGNGKVKDKEKGKDKDKASTTTSTSTPTSTSTTTTTVPGDATITTYAGNGVAGYSGDGGPATSASLAMDAGFAYCIRQPCAPTDNLLRDAGLALRADGSLYIADVLNNRVRKVAPSGEISTVAGTGARGYSGDDGPATAAALADPRGLAFDGTGNLYIADAGNHVVRKVDLAGAISTVAGSGVKGAGHNYSDDGGPATQAALCYPQGVVLDGADSLYIADTCNSSVRKVDAQGVITTVAGGPTAVYSADAGDGKQAVEVTLRAPGALALDNAGNIYVGGNDTLWKVEAGGTLRSLGDDIWAAGLAFDGESNLYFSAIFRYAVARLNLTTGEITVVAGTSGTWGNSGDGGPATQARLGSPTGLALGPSGLFIADAYSQRVRAVR